jgi:uncharacterized protein YqjF (DUF2071 family)
MKTLSQLAQERMKREFGEPWFYADWKEVLMLHLAVQPEFLQPHVPFELDLHEGLAYVSLVGFDLKRMRPTRGGAVGRMAFAPIATHPFLNVRTYVKHSGEAAIYFLAEWLPNRLSVMMGRPVFGLPYRLGELQCHHAEGDSLRGRVTDNQRSIEWRGQLSPAAKDLRVAEPGSLTEWLMERYTAFTHWMGFKRRFRIWHPPWQQAAVEVEIEEQGLLLQLGDWAGKARYMGAHWSPGFDDVWMGAPHWIN